MKVYVMKCGCRYKKKSDLVKIKKANRCPNHKDYGLDYIEAICCDCNAKMKLTPRQSTTKRCDLCKIKHKKMIDSRAYREYIERKRKESIDGEKEMDLSLYTQGLDRYLKK